MRTIVLAATVATVISTTFGIVSWHQQTIITRNYRLSQIRESEVLAEQVGEQMDRGDRYKAILTALSALPSDNSDRPFVPSAQLALENALEVYPSDKSWRSMYTIDNVQSLYACSDRGYQATIRLDGTVLVSELADGKVVGNFDPMNAMPHRDYRDDMDISSLLFCGDNLLCSTRYTAACFDVHTGKALWTIEAGESELTSFFSDIIISPDGSQLAFCITEEPSLLANPSNYRICMYETKGGTQTQSFSIPCPNDVDRYHTQTMCGCFSAAGSFLALAAEGRIYEIDLSSGKTREGVLSRRYANSVTYIGPDLAVICTDNAMSLAIVDSVKTLDYLDAKLNNRWSVDLKADVTVTAHGGYITAGSGVLGTYSNEDFKDGQIAAYCGSSILLLDQETGETTYEHHLPTPIQACMFTSMGSWLGVVDVRGNLVLRGPSTSSTTVPGQLHDQAIGETTSAVFKRIGDDCYLAAYDSLRRQFRIFKLTDLYDMTDVKELSRLDGIRTLAWNSTGERHLIGVGKSFITCVDDTTFQPLWSLNASDFLPYDGEPSLQASVGEEYVYVYDDLHDDMVYRLSVKDGSLDATVDLNKDVTDDFGITDVLLACATNRNFAVVYSHKKAIVVDLDTQGAVAWLETQGYPYDCLYANGSLVIAESNEGVRSFEVYDLDTTSPRETDLCECAIPDVSRNSYALSNNGEQFVVATKIGQLCLYETKSWTRAWESAEGLGAIQALAFSRDSRRIVAQDLTGMVYLLSAETGKVLRKSSTILGPINYMSYLDDEDALMAECDYPGISYGEVVVINTSEDSFGPESHIYTGVYLSKDGTTVLSHSPATGKFVSFHHLTLDELQARANDILGTRLYEEQS